MGFPDDPHFSQAAFPELNLAANQFCFVQPVPDNLVLLQFRILDPTERLVKKYAYDREFPERFSVYTYQEEERRQFEIFNQHLLSAQQRTMQRLGLQRLRKLSERAIKGEKPSALPPGGPDAFLLPGPALKLRLLLENNQKVNFLHLNLQPDELYTVEILTSTAPGLTRKNLAVKFTQLSSPSKTSIHYFLPGKKDFFQVIPATIDKAGRLTKADKIIVRPWDDE